MQESAVYISYAWNQESNAIANTIEKEFEKRGISIIRDKSDLKYKGKIKGFMKSIGRGKYVIIIISNKYLKSENCMFELLQIFKNQDFYDRIFPIVLDEVKISKASDRIDLVKYWENEADNLDAKIRELKKLVGIEGVTHDLNLYTEIRNNIAQLTNILKDINYLSMEHHISSNYNQLYETIQTKIKKDLRAEGNGGKTIKVIKKFAFAATGVIAVILIMQVISKKAISDKIPDRVKNEKRLVDERDSILNLAESDKSKSREDQVLDHKIVQPISIVKYNVILAVPSFMAKQDVYVDNKKAEVVERGLNYITVSLKKKSTSHHFEIRKGSQVCIADRLIKKDSLKFALLCD